MRKQVKSKKAKGKTCSCLVLVTFTFLLLPFAFAYSGEADDLKKELQIIQMKISEEEARYQAAKAQMERAQVVAQYLFPELRAREKQLVEKIEKLNGNEEASKK